jgi:hypothetical protein
LNLSSERVRAVISTNGSRRKALILVPEEVPPFDQVRKLYFEKQDDDGCRETIITAEAYFKDHAIVGLAFVYMSGRIASTGELDTETRQIVHFTLDARIVGLSVVATEHKLMEIEFEVERNEQPRYEKLRLSATLPNDLAHTAGLNRREMWCKDDASVESCQWVLEPDRVYKPPSGSRLIGIYMRCQEFYRVGALYESDVSQETKRALKRALRSILGYVLHQDRDKPPSIITFSPMVPTFLPDPMALSSSRHLAGDDRNTPTAVNLGLITSHIAILALNEDNVRLVLKLDVDPETLYTGCVWCLIISLRRCVIMLLYIFCIRHGWILRAGILRSYADGPC